MKNLFICPLESTESELYLALNLEKGEEKTYEVDPDFFDLNQITSLTLKRPIDQEKRNGVILRVKIEFEDSDDIHHLEIVLSSSYELELSFNRSPNFYRFKKHPLPIDAEMEAESIEKEVFQIISFYEPDIELRTPVHKKLRRLENSIENMQERICSLQNRMED